MLNISVRKALVLPTALTLALGGALLSASAANAATSGDLSVPVTTSTPSTYTVSYTGTAPVGDVIELQDADGGDLTDQPVDLDGNFTITYTFDNTADVDQNLFVDDTSDDVDAIPVTATLPSIAVSTPANGATVTAGSTVTVTGTAPAGATIQVSDDDTDPVTVPVTDGNFTTTLTAPTDETTDTIVVTGTTSAGEDLNEVDTDLTVTPVVVTPVPDTLTVTSPAGTTAAAPYVSPNRHFDISGKGTPGDEIDITYGDGVNVGSATVDANGDYTDTVVFGDPTIVGAQTLTVTQATPDVTDANGNVTESGVIVGTATVYATIPATPTVLAPVIITPTAGSSTGTVNVTFTGTSQPGTYVSVQALPTEFYAAATAEDPTPAQVAYLQSFDETTIPAETAPVLVDANGNWTVTQALPVGDWTAIAVDFANADGQPVDINGFIDAAAVGDPQQFFVTAAVVAAATGATPTGTLAFTGSQDTAPMIIGAGLLLMSGVGLTVVARRRRTLNV